MLDPHDMGGAARLELGLSSGLFLAGKWHVAITAQAREPNAFKERVRRDDKLNHG